MANPPKYVRLTDYSAATIPDLRSALNPEFSDIQAKYDPLVEAIKDVRRSDGELVNEIVKPDSLHPDTTALLDSKVADADAAKVAAEAAQSAAEDARDAAQTAQTGAETARTGAETAQAAAESAQSGAEDARDVATQKASEATSQANKAETQATKASASATSAFDAKLDAEAAASSAATAVRKAPNDVASTVFVDGRDWGTITESEPFSDEDIPGVRVDLSTGSSTIDLGGIV